MIGNSVHHGTSSDWPGPRLTHENMKVSSLSEHVIFTFEKMHGDQQA